MKNKKEIIITIVGLVLIMIGFLSFAFSAKEKAKKEEKPSIISTNDYNVSYKINEDLIFLTLNNNTKEAISFSQIEIKYNGKIIISYKNDFKITPERELPISFSNYDNLSEDSSLEIILYKVGNNRENILNKVSTYLCSKDNKKEKDYTSSFQYRFTYTDGTIISTKVYHEYQFKNKEAYRNFIYEVETDTDYYGDYENDDNKLIRQFIYKTTYPIPETIENTENNYVNYIEENFKYQCKRIEK